MLGSNVLPALSPLKPARSDYRKVTLLSLVPPMFPSSPAQTHFWLLWRFFNFSSEGCYRSLNVKEERRWFYLTSFISCTADRKNLTLLKTLKGLFLSWLTSLSLMFYSQLFKVPHIFFLHSLHHGMEFPCFPHLHFFLCLEGFSLGCIQSEDEGMAFCPMSGRKVRSSFGLVCPPAGAVVHFFSNFT